MKKRYKLRGAYLVIKLLLACFLIGLFLAAGVYSGSNVLTSYQASLIQEQGKALDEALNKYHKSHTTTVPSGKVDKWGVPLTKTCGIYPESIDELNHQVKYGYISFLMSNKLKAWSLHGSSAMIGDFYYETSEDRRAYLLQAKLPNGYIYTTPGSLYTIKKLDNASDVGSEISAGEDEWGSSIGGKSID